MSDEQELLSHDNKVRCIDELANLTSLRSSSKSAKSRAAVLVPLIKLPNGQVGLLYTKRSPYLSSHARQVCFPGGKVDDGETEIQAALRESHEELGIANNSNTCKKY